MQYSSKLAARSGTSKRLLFVSLLVGYMAPRFANADQGDTKLSSAPDRDSDHTGIRHRTVTRHVLHIVHEITVPPGTTKSVTWRFEGNDFAVSLTTFPNVMKRISSRRSRSHAVPIAAVSRDEIGGRVG